MLLAIRQETLVQAGEVLDVICDKDAVLLRGRPQYVRIILPFKGCVALYCGDVIASLPEFVSDARVQHLVKQ
jgi:hypothetical protein